MKTNPVGWFEIYVQGLSRAKKFYETVFATELQQLKSPMPGIEFLTFPMEDNAYGAPGALVKMEGVPGGGNSILVYFSCQDCAVEQGRVAAAGGQVEKPKMSIGEYGFISLVRDSEGNMIGLHSMQ
jgi:uncharacterized protein